MTINSCCCCKVWLRHFKRLQHSFTFTSVDGSECVKHSASHCIGKIVRMRIMTIFHICSSCSNYAPFPFGAKICMQWEFHVPTESIRESNQKTENTIRTFSRYLLLFFPDYKCNQWILCDKITNTSIPGNKSLPLGILNIPAVLCEHKHQRNI